MNRLSTKSESETKLETVIYGLASCTDQHLNHWIFYIIYLHFM